MNSNRPANHHTNHRPTSALRTTHRHKYSPGHKSSRKQHCSLRRMTSISYRLLRRTAILGHSPGRSTALPRHKADRFRKSLDSTQNIDRSHILRSTSMLCRWVLILASGEHIHRATTAGETRCTMSENTWRALSSPRVRTLRCPRRQRLSRPTSTTSGNEGFLGRHTKSALRTCDHILQGYKPRIVRSTPLRNWCTRPTTIRWVWA